MKIEHLAIWTHQLEAMKLFYISYFEAISGEKYSNRQKEFSSYFLYFEDGTRLELMHMPGIPSNNNDKITQHIGLNHFAISTGSKEQVDLLTEKIRLAGFIVMGEPR